MPDIQPTRSDVHVNRPLTNISIAYLQRQEAFVADRVFPNIPVAKQSDRYFTYDRGDFNRDEMKKRAPGTESSGSGYDIDNTPTYFADVWAHHKDIPDQIRSNADNPLNPDREATEFLTHKALIRRERQWAARFFTDGVWGTDVDGVGSSPGAGEALRWDDSASTPIEDVRAGATAMGESTGFRPNQITLGRAVFDILVDHPDIIGRLDRGQTQGPAMTNRQQLAALFEMDRVNVMDGIYNTADKGASNSHSFIGGKHALLSFSPPTPGIMTPSAGYTFSWTGYLGAGPQGTRISRFRMEHLKSDRVEIEMAMDQKLVSSDLGYFFNGIVA